MNTDNQISQPDFEEIERFVLQQMPANEHEAFAAKIAADNSLRNQVNEVRLLLLGVQEAALGNMLNEFHNDMQPAQKKGKEVSMFSRNIKWLAAACALVFVATIAWLFFGQIKGSEKLFAKYYKPDSGLITTMGTSDNYTFDKAMIDYKTGNYEVAIKAWEMMLIKSPESDTLNYFLASAYLAQNENEIAIKHYKNVVNVKDSYFINDANWYLGLALLRQDRKEEALPFIERAEHAQKTELLQQIQQ